VTPSSLVSSSDLAAEWDGLCDRTGAEPFLRPGWFRAWGDAFAPGAVRVITIRRDGRLVGAAPVIVRGGVVRSASNWHTPWFRPVAEDDDAQREIADRILRAAGRRASLMFVPAEDVCVEALAGAGSGHRVRTRVLERSPAIHTDGGYETYSRSLDSKLRSELRRRRRRLEEAGGEIRVDVWDGRAGLAGLLDRGFAIEAAGWKASRSSAIVSRPNTLRFYTALAQWAAARGWLRLAFLRAGDRAVAFDLCLEDRRHYLLKTGFDPAFAPFAPGTLLREAMIERAFREELLSYEFLGTDEPWKLQWTSERRELLAVDAFRRSVPGTLERWAEAYGRPAGSRIRRAVRSASGRR
jgi:CelD/BcsL family acetyltransferase involved in cellulose biosynthesis